MKRLTKGRWFVIGALALLAQAPYCKTGDCNSVPPNRGS